MKGEVTKTLPPLSQKKLDAEVNDTIPSNFQELGQNVQPKDAIIIVDVFSTGAMLAYYLHCIGYKLICVLSGDLKDLLDMKPEGLDYSFVDTLVFNTEIDAELAMNNLVRDLEGLELNIRAVMAGAETGVELADLLSERLNTLTNGTAFSEARRNKYIMGETVRNAGVRAVKQMKATSWGEIDEFLSAWQPNPFQVIVKPMDSAGSDDVTLCHNILEVQKAFGNIMGKVNGLGIVNKGVLVQEYLDGIEYVIDMVSREGEHKVVAIWE
jgi:biotin carboxylase